MKFVFINPNRSIDKKNIWNVVNSVTPPLGLATLCAVLENDGCEADIIDAFALNLETPQVLSSIDPAADFIGLTATTVEIQDVIGLARAARSKFPKAKILMGGVHPTVFHEALVKDGVCDMVIRGEGEDGVLAIARGQTLETVPNLTWRAPDGEVVVNPIQEHYVDLDSLPFPSYGKLPMDRYHSALGAARRSPSIGMITSRGCPGKCTFCYSGMYGSRIRLMSAERIIEQIQHLKSNYGIREISFYDDTFTTNRKRVERLCSLMLSEKLRVSWSCFARVDTVSPDILRLMKKAGCHQINYGFESVDEDILKAINKRVKAGSIADAISWTNDAGIDVRGAFMLGNAGETEESMRRTMEYSKNAGIQFAIYNITTPFPGTALFDWAKKEGLLMHTRWDLYDLAHPILELPTVQSEVVRQYYSRAYNEFYFRASYVLRRLLSIRTWYGFKTHVKAFLGILSALGGRKD